MKMLVGIDGSKASVEAAKYAAKLARDCRSKSHITLISVHDDTALKHFKRYVPKGVINDYLRELCSQDLQKAQKQLDADNVAHDMIIEFGNIPEMIVDAARKGNFDLIVLGAKGRTMIKEIVMGSVAMHVIALATIPVTLVR